MRVRINRQPKSCPGARGRLRQFIARDDDGGITIFVLTLTILLLVAGGMAVDYQRYELARADLQDALDRGVLAATNSNQLYDPSAEQSVSEQARDVISDYIAARNYRPAGLQIGAVVNELAGGRSIAASATEPLDTIFLRMIGIDRMNVVVNATAVQATPKLEITVVLDVSGSMGWNSTSSPGRKIDQLKSAAKEFLETILAPEVGAQTLITIVPFSQQVNLRREMADLYRLNRRHDFSSCFDFHSLDFDTVTMPTQPGTPYIHGQHFIESGSGSSRLFGCPKTNNAITPFSNNLAALSAAVDALTVETWTTTYVGVKWGAALLDPTSRPVVNAMIANGTLGEEFAGWPNDWDDPSTRKIAVVMSDGQNTRLNEIVESRYSRHPATYWNVNPPRSNEKYSVIDNERTGEGDRLLKDICDEIKAAGASTIYTIGFELAGQPRAEQALGDCASSPSSFYLVDGVEISTAFRNIADEIVNLKLTH